MLRVLHKTQADCADQLDRTHLDPLYRFALQWLHDDVHILLQRLNPPG